MALFKHLERDNWKEFSSEMFWYAVWTFRHDRFRHLGSSDDDLRRWLVAGGIPSIRQHLERGMHMRQLPEDLALAVMEHIDKLVDKDRSEPQAHEREGIIPADSAPDSGGLSASDVEDAPTRIAGGWSIATIPCMTAAPKITLPLYLIRHPLEHTGTAIREMDVPLRPHLSGCDRGVRIDRPVARGEWNH